MTTQQWLTKVRERGAVLREFVASWHPSARRLAAIQREAVLMTDGSAAAVEVPEARMPITAPGAERACQVVREQVRREQPEDPLVRWDKAVNGGNVSEIMSLLDEAWFGVPESWECWQIEGFAEAADLLDDPPDFEGESEDEQC